MSARHRPSVLRSTTARLAIAGAASLATVMAVAPMAVAEDDLAPSSLENAPADSTETETPTPAPVESEAPAPEVTDEAPVDSETPAEETPTDEVVPEETAPEDEATPSDPASEAPVEAAPGDQGEADPIPSAEDAKEARAEVEPIYGTQKYRVGVQIADGSYVPAGTSTVGSTFTIVSKSPDGAVTSTVTCTTVDSGDPTTSFCPGDGPSGSTTTTAGESTTITQSTAMPGLAPSTETVVIPACELEDASDTIPTCTGEIINIPGLGEVNIPSVRDVIFTNKGLAPVTTPDAASTSFGELIVIDVLANDDSDDPATTLGIERQPGNGKAEVIGSKDPAPTPTPTPTPTITTPAPPVLMRGVSAAAVPSAGTLAIRYTPAAGFSGTDTFDYSVTNSNGTTTGTVTVRVQQDESVDPIVDTDPGDDDDNDSGDDNGSGGSDDPAAAAPDSAALPDTGGPDAALLGYAALLIAGGGALTVGARRRPRRTASVD